jgi:hypothetical protein
MASLFIIGYFVALYFACVKLRPLVEKITN